MLEMSLPPLLLEKKGDGYKGSSHKLQLKNEEWPTLLLQNCSKDEVVLSFAI